MTKEKAMSVIVECAEKYRENLSGRDLLFLCMDKAKKITGIEVSFDAGNFLHLTGCVVKDDMSAKDFYRRCQKHRLSVNDFEFSSDGTTELKLKILPLLMTKNLSANFIGDFHAGNPKLYTEKIAGSVKGGIGFVRNKYGRYIPNTILKADIRKYVRNQARVIATFRKRRGDQLYTELVYRAKKIVWENMKINSDIIKRLSPELLKSLPENRDCGKLIR